MTKRKAKEKLTKEEQKRYKDYLKHYSFNFSDLPLVEELVFRETLHEQYQTKIKSLNDESNAKNIVPKHLMEALNENLEQIIKIKEKLGLFEEKNQKDALSYIKLLYKKFKIWMDNNKASRTFPCPYCSKMIMLKIRVKDVYDAVKHPFFKDKILFNEPLWKLYKAGKITKEELAEVFGSSPDYITWLEKLV